MSTIKKTEQFLYLQNKAKHYDTIRNMKPSVNDKQNKKYLRQTISVATSPDHTAQYTLPSSRKRLIPYNRECQIKFQNEGIVTRLSKIDQSNRTEVSAQGYYSRYNNVERKFRNSNPYLKERNRSINISNEKHQSRIRMVKPRIGSNDEWKKHFSKSVDAKRNMSRYGGGSVFPTTKSKQGSIHLSSNLHLPEYFSSSKPVEKSLQKCKQNTQESLLSLPNIQNKNHRNYNTITAKYSQPKLIAEKSGQNKQKYQQSGQDQSGLFLPIKKNVNKNDSEKGYTNNRKNSLSAATDFDFNAKGSASARDTLHANPENQNANEID